MAADALESGALSAPRDECSGLPSIAEVYAANFKYVWRCLRSLGVHDAALDDAVQDVFLVVQRRLDRFDGKAQLRSWLYAIALRVARRYRARAAKDALKFGSQPSPGTSFELDDAVELEPNQASANLEHDLEHGERLKLARRALEALDQDKREVFVLAYVEQMSAPEIAEITGLPVNTVYSRLRAARLAFGAIVNRMQPLPRRPR
jgi:RNA polymerase sigma-70 factor (ECF subfamily)